MKYELIERNFFRSQLIFFVFFHGNYKPLAVSVEFFFFNFFLSFFLSIIIPKNIYGHSYGLIEATISPWLTQFGHTLSIDMFKGSRLICVPFTNQFYYNCATFSTHL